MLRAEFKLSVVKKSLKILNVLFLKIINRAWGFNTFGFDNRLADSSIGPIEDATLILFDPNDSQVINKGGQKM